MKKFSFLLLTFPLFLFGEINGKADYQFWQRAAFKTEMHEKWTFVLSQETRFGDDVSNYYFGYLQANFDYELFDWFSISPGYRQILKRFPLSSTHLKLEYSPLIDIFFKNSMGTWKFVNRHRVQYLIFESNPSHWLYRNQIRFISPWSWTRFNANPYFEFEFFWREGNGVNENRITYGINEKLTSHVSIDLFYISRFLKSSGGWNYNNVFGLNLLLRY